MAQPTITDLTAFAEAYPRLYFFFGAGRLHIGRVRYSCPWCGSDAPPRFYRGCLGFEGLECPRCGFMDDANEDGNRASAAEHGMAGALYALNLRGV